MGRMCGNGKSWLQQHGFEKLQVMGVHGDYEDFTNATAYRAEVTERLDRLPVAEAYCGTSTSRLPTHVHQGVGAQEYGGRARPVGGPANPCHPTLPV